MKNPTNIMARAALLLTLLLSACQFIPSAGGKPTQQPSPTPNLTPTPALARFTQVPLQACPLAQLKTISTSQDQGSLIAWSPDGKSIAYVTPTTSHAMFSGSLVVASAPSWQPSAPIAVNVTGSVTWSPSGDRIAFTTLRVSDAVTTVMVTNLSGNIQTDLFPGQAARFDNYSSPKSIISWSIENQLTVQAACGDGCAKLLDVEVPGGSHSDLPTPEPTQQALNWTSPRYVRNYDTKSYPTLNDPNWSSDGSRLTYFDDDGYLWVLLEKNTSAFQLEMQGAAVPVYLKETWNRETRWAPDGKLAVRIGDVLELFSIPCTPKAPE